MKILFIGIMLFLFSLSLSTVCGAEINISNGDNLGQTIANASDGDIINLDTGIYTNNVTNIIINKNLTLKGNGETKDVVIDGQGMGRIFTINNNLNATFINITFINGNVSGDGGAIYSFTTNTRMSFINCIFTNNSARGSYANGGAIYNYGNNFEVINCTFTNNRAACGGAIYVGRSNFTLINSTFINNSVSGSEGYGGAIYDEGSFNSTLENCTFINNTALWGGAIFTWWRNGVRMTNCTFTDNRATFYGAAGGAIYTEGDNHILIDCTFTNNNASYGYGGAIINHGANFSVINCTFTNNRAYISGGAIYNHHQTTYSTGTFNFTVTNSTFINNTADFGGAIYNIGNSSIIRNSKFTENNADSRGGAIYNSANITVAACNFTDNFASSNGGAIYNNLNMSLNNNIMRGNIAGLGHMIYNNGRIGILNLTFLNNTTIPVRRNHNITLFATLTDDMGNTVTGQNINFLVNGIAIASVTSIEGYANLSYLTPNFTGLIPVTGNYLGHSSYPIILLNGQLRVIIPTNTTIVVVPDTVKVGEATNISGVLSDEDDNFIANVTINITVDGQTFIETTNNVGAWSLIYSPRNARILTVIVQWEGNADYFGFTNSTSFNVVKLITNTTIIVPANVELGENVNISGVLYDEDGNILANVEFNLTVDGIVYILITDNAGQWNLSYNTSRTGAINVIATFAGNNVYYGFENMTSFNVVGIGENNSNSTNETNNNTNNNNETNNNTNDNNETNNHINNNNETNNNTNNNNETSNYINQENNSVTGHVPMKKTGMRIIAILAFLGLLSTFLRKKLD